MRESNSASSHFIRHRNSSFALFPAAAIRATSAAAAAIRATPAISTTPTTTVPAAASGLLISLEAGLPAIAGCPRISTGLIST
jgi:hypothetical protein